MWRAIESWTGPVPIRKPRWGRRRDQPIRARPSRSGCAASTERSRAATPYAGSAKIVDALMSYKSPSVTNVFQGTHWVVVVGAHGRGSLRGDRPYEISGLWIMNPGNNAQLDHVTYRDWLYTYFTGSSRLLPDEFVIVSDSRAEARATLQLPEPDPQSRSCGRSDRLRESGVRRPQSIRAARQDSRCHADPRSVPGQYGALGCVHDRPVHVRRRNARVRSGRIEQRNLPRRGLRCSGQYGGRPATGLFDGAHRASLPETARYLAALLPGGFANAAAGGRVVSQPGFHARRTCRSCESCPGADKAYVNSEPRVFSHADLSGVLRADSRQNTRVPARRAGRLGLRPVRPRVPSRSAGTRAARRHALRGRSGHGWRARTRPR